MLDDSYPNDRLKQSEKTRWRHESGFFRSRQEDISKMQWNRSNTIGIAKSSCTYCHGNGTRLVRNGREVPCRCVFRAAFRACWNRFRECAAKGVHSSAVTLELCDGRESRRTFSRMREEYMADFCLVSRRILNDQEHRIFRAHFLLGADWKLCCRQLKLDRGNFFHGVYRIEQKLGRAFADLEPYPLFPLEDYFSGLAQKVVATVRPIEIRPPSPKGRPVRVPLSA